MYAALKNRFYTWIFRWRGPESGAIVLVQRRVFILPTRQGLVFAVVLLVMLAGSINYSLGLGFVLTFLLGALGVNAMIYTFRNLANLRVTGGRTRPVFAGGTAFFTVHLENGGDADRYAIGLTHDRTQASFVDLTARSTTPVTAAVPALRRGILRPGRLTLFTRFPLGLYYAWAYLDLDLRCIVIRVPPLPACRCRPLRRAPGPAPNVARARRIFLACASTIWGIRRATSRGRPPRATRACSPSSSPAAPKRSCGSIGRSCRRK